MTVECPRCHLARWVATGRAATTARGLMRDQLCCVPCGYTWWSGLPDARAAGDQVRHERGDTSVTELSSAQQLGLPGLPTPVERLAALKARLLGDAS